MSMAQQYDRHQGYLRRHRVSRRNFISGSAAAAAVTALGLSPLGRRFPVNQPQPQSLTAQVPSHPRRWSPRRSASPRRASQAQTSRPDPPGARFVDAARRDSSVDLRTRRPEPRTKSPARSVEPACAIELIAYPDAHRYDGSASSAVLQSAAVMFGSSSKQ
jgi:hypothetical protein